MLKVAIISTFFLLFSLEGKVQENKIIKDAIICERFKESIWIPSQSDFSYKAKADDTTTNTLNLTFETKFDDSVKIFLNTKEIYSKKIKTLKYQGVVNDGFTIDYSGVKAPCIKILLVSQNRYLSFTPKKGYVFCFLNRINESWDVEFSNYPRFYY